MRCRCNAGATCRSGSPSAEEQVENEFQEAHTAAPILSARSTAAANTSPPDLNKVPLYPEEDLLIFIRDHNPPSGGVGEGSADHRP